MTTRELYEQAVADGFERAYLGTARGSIMLGSKVHDLPAETNVMFRIDLWDQDDKLWFGHGIASEDELGREVESMYYWLSLEAQIYWLLCERRDGTQPHIESNKAEFAAVKHRLQKTKLTPDERKGLLEDRSRLLEEGADLYRRMATMDRQIEDVLGAPEPWGTTDAKAAGEALVKEMAELSESVAEQNNIARAELSIQLKEAQRKLADLLWGWFGRKRGDK